MDAANSKLVGYCSKRILGGWGVKYRRRGLAKVQYSILSKTYSVSYFIIIVHHDFLTFGSGNSLVMEERHDSMCLSFMMMSDSVGCPMYVCV